MPFVPQGGDRHDQHVENILTVLLPDPVPAWSEYLRFNCARLQFDRGSLFLS